VDPRQTLSPRGVGMEESQYGIFLITNTTVSVTFLNLDMDDQ
jgi:hypothetical protein